LKNERTGTYNVHQTEEKWTKRGGGGEDEERRLEVIEQRAKSGFFGNFP
jgi:hypothetical protein